MGSSSSCIPINSICSLFLLETGDISVSKLVVHLIGCIMMGICSTVYSLAYHCTMAPSPITHFLSPICKFC